jgi:hypothetical protein
VLFPPVTALEVVSTRVHEEMVVLTMQPSLRAPPTRTDAKGVLQSEAAASKQRAQKWRTARTTLVGKEMDRGSAAAETWRHTAGEARIKCMAAKAAACEHELAQTKASALAARMAAGVTGAEKRELQEEMTKLRAELEWAKSRMKNAKAAAEKAQERELVADAVMVYELATENPHLARVRSQEAVGSARDSARALSERGSPERDKSRLGMVMGVAGFEQRTETNLHRSSKAKLGADSSAWSWSLDEIPFKSISELSQLATIMEVCNRRWNSSPGDPPAALLTFRVRPSV